VTMRPPRTVLAAAGFFAASLAAASAWAQTGGTTGTNSSFTADDFFIGVQHPEGANLSDLAVSRFFNKARCDCDEPATIYVTLVASGFAKRPTAIKTGTIEFWVGTGCDNTLTRGSFCKLLDNPTWSQFLTAGHWALQTTARIISTYTNSGVGTTDDAGVTTTGNITFPPDGTVDCTAPVETFNQSIWVLVSTTTVGVYDIKVTRSVPIRLQPPPAPGGTTVDGGNQGLIMSWTKLDTSIYQNVLGYQILCNRAGSLPVFAPGTFAAGFQSCPAKATGEGVVALDPAFICSPLLTASASTYRVGILQNDISYSVAVVTVDTSGNASIPDLFYGTPIKTKSFYDVYRDGNTGTTGGRDLPGGANGGFCNLAPDGATPRWAATALAAAALAIAARRRRRGR
jgi:hypothetical protein